MTRRSPALFFLFAMLLLPGCANYQLGTGAHPGFATLYVAPVANQTLMPQAQAIISTQLRTVLGRDGRVTLVNSPESADATLTVVIHDYHRDIRAVREDDTGLARKFALILAVDCTLRDNRTGHDLFTDRRVTVSRDAFTDGGQLQSEYQMVPLLAESLADKISHAVLDVW